MGEYRESGANGEYKSSRVIAQELQRKNRRKRRVRRQITAIAILSGTLTALLLILVFLSVYKHTHPKIDMSLYIPERIGDFAMIMPIDSAAAAFPELDIEEDYLTENPYSRPGTKLGKVKKIVVHYTANPGTGAHANRNYFEGLSESGDTYASSHFIIDLNGNIIQCIPLNEVAYASNEANSYSISIECCHEDAEGEFNTSTYNNCVELVARLCEYYQLDPAKDVLRHYDITGKECPLYYVRHPEEWELFLSYVAKEMGE